MAETWTKTRVMQELKDSGTEQNRKVYKRHGVLGKQFGVSYAHLKRLLKLIKTNTPLAQSLWKSGNHDARVLATMIANPAELGADGLNTWAAECENHVLAGGVASCCSAHPDGWAIASSWTESPDDLISSSGFGAMSHLLRKPPFPAAKELGEWIRTIRDTIHDRPNQTRYAMNGALIAIGLVSPGLQKQAIAAARKVGKVEVDHGETGCKTPDAEAYILKAAARKKPS